MKTLCKLLILALLCLGVSAFNCFAREFSPFDYLNRPLPVLLEAEGPPDFIGMLNPPYLTLQYSNTKIGDAVYDVFYTLNGANIVAVEHMLTDGGNTAVLQLNAAHDFSAMLGQTRAQAVHAFGLPYMHLMRPFETMEEMLYNYIDAAGATGCLTYHLENGAVHTAVYLYNGGVQGADIVPFIHGLRDKLTPYFDNAAWVEKELDLRAVADDGRYSLVRIAANAEYNVSFMALGTPHMNELDAAVTFVNRQARDSIGQAQTDPLDAFVRNHWNDKDYINSGNYELLETFGK